jgi:hypothetical protein
MQVVTAVSRLKVDTSKKFARVYEAFGIRDSIGGLSTKIKDHMCNMVLDSVKTTNKMGLLTEIAVTHAGIINGNMGYYPPDCLRASTDSWTVPYKKPVLSNHDKNGDPLGRNIGSVYKSSVPTFVPKVMASVYDTDYTYRGLGHLQNLVSVANAEAVQKVLDGRYETVSVSGDTDSMTCSICDTDWLAGHKCEHRFGNEYVDEQTDEKKLAYWISGNFIWDELSFVNEPADPFAQIISREVDPSADDQILKVYNYKDVTAMNKQTTDSRVRRLLNIYAVNDSRNMKLALNDQTSVDALYKVYGQKTIGTGFSIVSDQTPNSKGEEQALEDTNKETAQTPVEAVATKPEGTPIVADGVVAPAVAGTVAAPPAVVSEPKVETVSATPVVTDALPETTKVEDARPAPAPKTEPSQVEDTKVKELEAKIAALETDNKSLQDQAIALQSKIKDSKINRILDLKVSLSLDTYPTEDARKGAFDSLQTRSMDSLEDALKDLEDSWTKHREKKIVPKDITIKGIEDNVENLNPLEQIQDNIEKADPMALVLSLMSGSVNPPTR